MYHPSPMSAVQEMIDLLQMEQIEENLFRAQNGPGNHVFGGQMLGQAIFNMSSSFQVEEGGLQHQSEMPDVPPPDELPSDGDIYRKMAKDDPSYRRFAHRFDVIDSRQVEGIQMLPRGRGLTSHDQS